ncbi:unnamed protein product [Ambrosiozyma monospora]|uniref:Unnamed protein product n=1 Tax=Ambrosiozyma monospora TaxID=43982 RepID=A0ACB5T2T7_AMBMO|nr:unnamed protein product [Ambrosiozyma monospora]
MTTTKSNSNRMIEDVYRENAGIQDGIYSTTSDAHNPSNQTYICSSNNGSTRLNNNQLKSMAIPVTIPENNLFNFVLDPTWNIMGTIKRLREFTASHPATGPMHPSLKEANKLLTNIKEEVYMFTVSQLLHVLCTFDYVVSNNYHIRLRTEDKDPENYTWFNIDISS